MPAIIFGWDRCTATQWRLIKFHHQPFHVSEQWNGRGTPELIEAGNERRPK
jgi:hypothetical protein